MVRQLEKDYDEFMERASAIFWNWDCYTINRKDAEFFEDYSRKYYHGSMYYCFIDTKETKNYYPECDWPRKEYSKELFEHRKFKKLFKNHKPIRFLNRVIFCEDTKINDLI